jgi:hypothetical protein
MVRGSVILALTVDNLLAVLGKRPEPDGRATLVKVIDVLNRGGLQLTQPRTPPRPRGQRSDGGW